MLYKYKNKLLTNIYQTGQGIVSNPSQLIERIKLLGGSIITGNRSAAPEFVRIAKSLTKNNILPQSEYDELIKRMKKYLNIK